MPTHAQGLGLNVNSPCEADWDSMAGNDEVRFCTHCEKSVHNVSAMTRKDAMRFVRANAGGVCVRFYNDPTGRTLHAAEGKLHRITRRASLAAAGAFGAVIALGSSVLAQTPAPGDRQEVASKSDASKSGESKPDAEETQATGEQSLRPDDGGPPRVMMGMVVRIRPDDPVVRAVYDRDPSALKRLIALGADVNVLDKATRTTALIEAVSNNDAEVVSMLMSAGAGVNMKDTDGDTALTSLSEDATVAMVRTLTAAGAKVNHRNDDGTTPLINVAKNDTPEVLKELLEAGAKVNAKDEEGRTALMESVQYGLLSNVKLLLDAGADVNVRDKGGDTALKIANESLAAVLEAAKSEEAEETKEAKEARAKETEDLRKLVALLVSYGAIE